VVVVIVNVEVPLPPAVSVTEGALTETDEAVPFVELTVVANETVPA
jgi:hypothetical protein